MSSKPTLTDRVRKGEPLPWFVGAALQLGTPFMRWGMRRRLRIPPTRVDARVISFGNLTAGGTGKTPAVIECARRELEEGNKVAVLTRGYKSPAGGKLIASPDLRRPEDAELLGDEAALLLQKLPDLIVIKDANRLRGARTAIRRFQCNVLILDDGYQHTAIERDENVLLIDASNPFGSGHVLPRGILRESPEAMNRATSIIITHWDQAVAPEELVKTIEKNAPGVPVRKTRHAPMRLRRLSNGSTLPLDTLAGKDVRAACAIGNPDNFFQTLEDLGANLVERKSYMDHHAFTVSGDGFVVVTDKDAIRMHDPHDNIYTLEIELADF